MEIIPEAVGKSYHIQTDLIEPDTPLPPKGGIVGGAVEFAFDKFWDIYPKHKDDPKMVRPTQSMCLACNAYHLSTCCGYFVTFMRGSDK